MATRDLSKILARHMGIPERQRITPGSFQQTPGPAVPGPGMAPLTRNVYPPWVFKLPMSQDFNANNFNLAMPAVAGSVVELVAFRVPATFVGWLQIFGIYILSPTNATDLTFTLQINEGPVQGWDNIKFPPGVANFVVQNFADLQVRVPTGARVRVVATNNAATGPWTIGAKIAGWYHPESEEARIYGSL
jgi:hypothetical protein